MMQLTTSHQLDPLQLAGMGALGRNRFTFATNQGLAAVQIDALGRYIDIARTRRNIHSSASDKTAGVLIPTLATFERKLRGYEALAAEAVALITAAAEALAIRPYRGRGHRGTSSVESWALAVEMDLGAMRRLLPRLDDADRDTSDAQGAALVEVQKQRAARGENVTPWRRSPARRRIDWNSTSELELFKSLRSITPIRVGIAFGGATAIVGLAALFFFLRRR